MSLEKLEQIIQEMDGVSFDKETSIPMRQGLPEPETMGQMYLQNLEDTYTGFKTGVGNTWGGIQQLFGGDKERLGKEYQQRMADFSAASERSPWLTGGAEIAGAAAALPIPGLGQAKLAATLFARSPILANLVGQTFRGMTEGAIASGLQYAPEGTTQLENALPGGGYGAMASLALGLPGSIVSKLKPSNLFKSNLSDADLMANLEATKGTETNLGRVLGNKSLSGFYENVLTEIPFSGAADISQKTAQQITSKADDLMMRLSGTGDGSSLLQGLREGKYAQGKTKSEKYNAVNALADELGVNAGRRNINEVAQRYLDDIASDADLASELPGGVVEKLRGYADPNRKSTFKGSDISRAKMRETSKKYSKEGEDYVSGIYRDLQKARDLDIDESVSLFPELQKLRQDAHEFYGENYAPFKKKEIARFVNDFESNPDKLVASFFQAAKGGKENAHSLKILMDAIEKSPNADNLKGIVRKEVLSPAFSQEIGSVNPAKLSTLFKNIGPRQRDMLFGGDENTLKAMSDISRATNLNQDALNIMFNPSTGKREIPWKSLAAILSSITSGYAAAGVPGALAGAIAPTAAGKYATNKLTSEKTREKLVKKMLAPKGKETTGQKLRDELKRGASRGYAASREKE